MTYLCDTVSLPLLFRNSSQYSMDFTRAICRSANRIHLAAHFSITSRCPQAARRTVIEATRIGQSILSRVDPFALRLNYPTIVAGNATVEGNAGLFQTTVGDLLQGLCVHQISVARVGSSLCNWDGLRVPFEQLADALDALYITVNSPEQSVCDHLLSQGSNETTLLAFSDVFYGLAVVLSTIKALPNELNGLRREVALAGASVVLESSKRLSHSLV